MTLRRLIRRFRTFRRWPSLEMRLVRLHDLAQLMTVMGWKEAPIIDGHPHLGRYDYAEDANRRRLRDAEVIAAACRNAGTANLLEIGTSLGHTTALMAINAAQATVHTVNIPPEEISLGGTLVTHAPSRDETGSYYRQLGLTNIRQIFANTATWKPQLPPIDVAFIDGCHDEAFVINDTRKILPFCRPGSILLWHDANPDLDTRFSWMADVCSALDHLVETGEVKGELWLVRDSWVMVARLSA
jgi:predicted O-methyltransferase YrrM